MARDERVPRERARDCTEPVLYYYLFWWCEHNDKPQPKGTREIRMNEQSCNLAAQDLFGVTPTEAEVAATQEAFFWMPVKQAWALVAWALDKMGENHERFTWLRQRVGEEPEGG